MTINKSKIQDLFTTVILSTLLLYPATSFAIAQKFKLPPIDFKDTNRCLLVSSSIGQANAARDKLYDLRQCDLKGTAKSL
jgi:hypothetical protein